MNIYPKNIKHTFVLLALLALPGASETTKAATPAVTNLSYVDILHQLTDLDRLTHLQTGIQSGLFSSWDRNSHTVWGANGDAGQYLRTETNGEAVMMDIDGPGVIYRTWSANPMGKIRIYLDGDIKPTYEWNFPDLFDGKLPPFIKPIVYRRDSAQSASDCYLPIPFSKHIKITADKAHGEYYQFNYLLYPKGSQLSSFHLPLTGDQQAALEAAAATWSHPEKDPKPVLPDQRSFKKTFKIGPGKSVTLASLRGPGVIRSIKMKVTSKQRYAWRKLLLAGVWDKAAWPQILTPIGPFFGFDWDTADYASVIAGCKGGQAYQYYPMPFHKSGSLTLKNFLEQEAAVEVEIEWAPVKKLPQDSVYFYARWRHEPDSMTFDYPFLETAGRGHFVGVSMPIDHPLGGWWGEGDDKIWVDDDDFPPWIGTGSEDYFGDAWGIRYLSGPSFGAAADSDTLHRTSNYRWHFMDFVPFDKRFRMTIENYGPNGVGPRGQYDYSSTAFWYQQELTPPFAQLKGVKFTGGDDPLGKPKTMEYNPGTMMDIAAADLRTYGLGITFAQQAETIFKSAGARAKVITDARLPYEFDRERALDLGMLKSGDHPGAVTLTVTADGVYYPKIYTAPAEGTAELSFEQNGAAVKVTGRPHKNVLELAGLYLTKGQHQVPLIAASAGHGIFNCLSLEPANREHDAIEAEELTVSRATGGASLPHPGEASRAFSAGRALEFHAEHAGAGFVINLGKRPALPYALGVRPVLGPASGIIQAFSGDVAIGPKFDLYSPTIQPGDAMLPLGPVPAGKADVEIRVVGQNPASKGFDAAFDYFRWEPDIIGPGTLEGVWAQVAGRHDCEYRAQDLGPAYSGGHQFWVQPCNLNSWIDIAIVIPTAGEYTLDVRYVKSWDYATIQATLDGKPVGSAVDCYAAAVAPADTLTLAKQQFTAGRHILRFQAVGHNAESKGYLMGIDHIVVK